MINRIFVCVITLLLTSNLWAQSNFNDIRTKIYELPQEELPQYPGLNVWDVLSSLVGSEDNPEAHDLITRSRITLVDTSDERLSEPKWLHPRGACAEAKWEIDEETEATGLFSKGTSIPAIVRISSGTSASEYSEDFDGRILGMAIKLFPTISENQNVLTRNIVTLDQYGFENSKRKHTFWEDDEETPIYFTNVAPAKSFLGKFLSTFFDRFDNPNWARPLYQVAQARLGGGNLLKSKIPYEVRYQTKLSSIRKNLPVAGDFRTELKALDDIEMDIILVSFDGKKNIDKKIGTLSFGSFQVSEYCDLNLHFHHNSIEDQWEKYMNYDVVKHLLPN